jgi:hypothetical protein
MSHDQEVVGSNTGPVYWMDVSNYAINAIKIIIINKNERERERAK